MVQLARKVLKNSFFNSSRALISGIGGLAFSIALARLLSPELFGIYALALSVCFFILQLDPGPVMRWSGTSRMPLGKMNLAEARGGERAQQTSDIYIGVSKVYSGWERMV